MSVAKLVRYLFVVALAIALGAIQISPVLAADATSAPAGNGEFDGSTFKCLDYTNGLGDNASTKMQSVLGQLWMQGYLAGYYKGQGKLELSDDKADDQKLSSVMLQQCRQYPGSAILTVAQQAIGKDVYKIPSKTIADFSVASYTCGQQVDAKGGSAGDANKADLADLWSFAFIQGFKNATARDMVISVDNKSVLTGAIARSCGKNRDMTLLDMTALVADKVKLQ
ncbi:MAG: hypothetical protein EPO08_01645 [Rhodospirillaceae bacterium]|nr:MAG: hypothetical protein EPO08_01645 [Rhodospirillaceae bacterium]